VFRAGNGFEAIHVLDREGEMALVISELSMPVVDGVEFLMGMMHAYPDTVRVVLTRSLDPDLLLAAVNDLKLFRYMVKPFNREELLLVVHQGVETYRKNKAPKVTVPPPAAEHLIIDIDQEKCRAQVEALVASPLFQALSQEADTTPPPATKSEYFSFLDDYQTPEVELSLATREDETIPQSEDDTIFLIRDFVTNIQQPEPEPPATKKQPGSLQPKAAQKKPTTPVLHTIKPDRIKKAKPPEPTLPQIEPLIEDDLIEEIDTLIQKLEGEETTKGKITKKSDNPLDSPEFRELQRQSNALIARIIKSWG
jgi:CheY-like chemotaxis protein